jgi:hypothetical protein
VHKTPRFIEMIQKIKINESRECKVGEVCQACNIIFVTWTL